MWGVFFFFHAFSSVGRVRKAVCICWKEQGNLLSRTRGEFFSFIKFPLPLPLCSCSYFGNTLMQYLQLYEIFVWKQKDCKKYTFKRNNLLHVYYTSLNKQENFQKQIDPRERIFMIIIFILIKCCGLNCVFGSVSSTNNMIHYELDSSFGFSLSFSHLWSVVWIKDSFQAIFLISKLKQYPFRDFTSCIKKHMDDNINHSIFESPFKCDVNLWK